MEDHHLSLDQLTQSENSLDSESGQVFFEFILLLLVMITISYTMLYGVNRGIAERWQAIVHVVTKVEGSSPPEIN